LFYLEAADATTPWDQINVLISRLPNHASEEAARIQAKSENNVAGGEDIVRFSRLVKEQLANELV